MMSEIEQRLRAARLRWHGATLLLNGLQEQRPAGAFGPNYFLLDVLYSAVRRIRPKVLVEFGSGWSTYLIAQALADNSRDFGVTGHLFSVDADLDWARVTGATIPPALRSFCTVQHSPIEPVEVGGALVFRHVAAPTVAADVVVVDGPALTPAIKAICDPLDIEARTGRGVHVLCDKRQASADFLMRNLRHRHRMRIIRGVLDPHAFVPYIEPLSP